MKANTMLVFTVLSLLLGCQGHSDSLEEFVAQIRPKVEDSGIKPKPLIESQVFQYKAHKHRHPFELPQTVFSPEQQAVGDDCWQPEEPDTRTQLEGYSLNELQFKGVIESEGQTSALIQTPIGYLVKVGVGQYIGSNNGKISHISTDSLSIHQARPDGNGCWKTHTIKLALKSVG